MLFHNVWSLKFILICFQELCHQVLKGNIPPVRLVHLSQQDMTSVEVKYWIGHKKIHVK